MNEDKKENVLRRLEIIIASIGLLLLTVGLLLSFFPKYFPDFDANYFDFAVVLPITLILELILEVVSRYKNKT